jgi:hypothetical protein
MQSITISVGKIFDILLIKAKMTCQTDFQFARHFFVNFNSHRCSKPIKLSEFSFNHL